jgi:hypothetical protein
VIPFDQTAFSVPPTSLDTEVLHQIGLPTSRPGLSLSKDALDGLLVDNEKVPGGPGPRSRSARQDRRHFGHRRRLPADEILLFLRVRNRDIIASMADTWITDVTHFLGDGRLPREFPRPARRLVEYLGRIVAAVSGVEPDDPLGVRWRRCMQILHAFV